MSGIIEHNVPFTEIACNTCKHFHRSLEKISCDAFDRIPKEIITGIDMHTEPMPGQKNNIVYEKE